LTRGPVQAGSHRARAGEFDGGIEAVADSDKKIKGTKPDQPD
jgi:hypothetical protein